MVERNPWYSRVKGPFPEKYGCVGVKEDGGGSMRGRGLVGKMRIHRAVFNRDADLVAKLIAEGDDVNEVEAAGNTPLHNAAYDGWCEGIELLCEHGAKLNASNNAGDTPYHWAMNMFQDDAAELLVKKGADKDYRGRVIVPEHIPKLYTQIIIWLAEMPKENTRTERGCVDCVNCLHYAKVKDFYDLPDGVDHPKPSMEFMEWQKEMDREREFFEQKQAAAWSAPGKPTA